MQTKRVNLFLGDRSFMQYWTLAFKESFTEKKYAMDRLRFYWQSLKYLFLWTLALFSVLCWTGQLTVVRFCTAGLVLLCSMAAKKILVRRTLLQVVLCIWQWSFFEQGTLGECFGILFPSFLVNSLLLSSWKSSFGFFLIDGFTLYLLNPECKVSLLISICSYCLICSLLEKDFRDLWHLYLSTKKSNSLNKALWDNFPGAELLVNAEGKIVYYNKTAAKLLSMLKLPVEVLNGGNFEDFFPEFKVNAKLLMKNSFKGQLHEEVHVFKYQEEDNKSVDIGFLVTADLFSWTSGNCSRIMCYDVTGHISKKSLTLLALRDIASYFEYLNKQIIQLFCDSEAVSKEFITMYYRVHQHFKAVEVIQAHFAGEIEVRTESFDVYGEVFNAVEMLYLKACNHNVRITYTKEPAIPENVTGDKALHEILIFSVLDFVIQNALEGSDVFIMLQIAAADSKELTLSYRITFRSVKVTNFDIENLITTQKNSSGAKDINEINSTNKKYGPGLASVDTILLVLKGFLLPMNSEVDCNKVIINICLPFLTSTKRFKADLIQISTSTVQETNLTTKWKPDLGIYKGNESGDLHVLKDQVALVNSRHKLPKICIEKLENFEYKPKIASNSDSSASIYEAELGEENDASEKIKNYHKGPPVMKKDQKPVLRNLFNRQDSENLKNVVIVDENGENKKSLGNPEQFKENIWFTENAVKGLEVCEHILREGKKIAAFLFGVNRNSDNTLVEGVRRLETEFKCKINACGLSFMPADLNYCKLIDVKHFSKDYLVVKPISYYQVNALMVKLEQMDAKSMGSFGILV